jgi:hypothetical protein
VASAVSVPCGRWSATNSSRSARSVIGFTHFPFGPRGSTVSGRHLKSEGGELAGARLASDLFAAAAVSSQDPFVSNADTRQARARPANSALSYSAKSHSLCVVLLIRPAQVERVRSVPEARNRHP